MEEIDKSWYKLINKRWKKQERKKKGGKKEKLELKLVEKSEI